MLFLTRVDLLSRRGIGRRDGKGDSSANGGAVVIRKNVERAAQEGHALTHTGDADAQACIIGFFFVRQDGHASSKIEDFENDD